MSDNGKVKRNRMGHSDIVKLTMWVQAQVDYAENPPTVEKAIREYKADTGQRAAVSTIKLVFQGCGIPLRQSIRRSRTGKGSNSPRLERLIREVVHLSDRVDELHRLVTDQEPQGMTDALLALAQRRGEPIVEEEEDETTPLSPQEGTEAPPLDA
jgi:hypothetical protein